MKIKKYGGSSLKDLGKIKAVAKQIVKDNDKQLIVVSAPFGFTNDILKKAKELSLNPSLREIDQMIVTGEMINASLLTIAINELGRKAYSCNAMNIDIVASNDYGDGRIISIDKNKIEALLEEYDILVITGFQGVNGTDFVSLGRGGSDTTALALGAIYGSPCYIYTDVNGVYSIDPKLGIKGRKLPYISYDEMLELSLAGGKVLAPKASAIASEYQVTTTILESLSNDGTEINSLEEYGPKAVSVMNVTKKDNNSLFIDINGDKYYKDENGEYSLVSIVGSFLFKTNIISNINELVKNLDVSPISFLVKDNLIILIINNVEVDKLLVSINEIILK